MKYDCLVIGSGAAGNAVSAACVHAGWKTAVADSAPFGGTCALRGCNPKKALTSAVVALDRVNQLRGKGLAGNERIDWAELERFERSVVDPVPERSEERLRRLGIQPVRGRCRFTGPNSVETGGEEIEARFIVIASGARPKPLGIPGESHMITSDSFFKLERLPESMVCIGGGYISFEFAHIAARTGVRTVIIESSGRVLDPFDPDLADMLVRASRKAGMEIWTGMPVAKIEQKGDRYIVHAGKNGGRSFETGVVLHGAGRVSNVTGLDLDRAGIRTENGEIVVNEFLQSVSNPSIYVAGDAHAGSPQLTPVATMEGEIVAHNLLHGNSARPDYTGIPSVVFTSPPLAMAGLSEAEAAGKVDCTVVFRDTSNWMVFRLEGVDCSGIKLIAERNSGSIIGAHLLGYGADEAINSLALAIRHKMRVGDLREMPWAYPTVSSTIRYLARDSEKSLKRGETPEVSHA